MNQGQDPANGGENLQAGLASVKYKSILPMGKQSGYTQNEKVQFEIPPEIGYFDGKQSYLNIVVRNTTSSQASPYPVCFPPHIGAHALINRMQLQDMKGMELENIEQYNLYTGIINSYCNDSDTYNTISKVEGIAAHNPLAHNRGINDPKVNYFVQNPSSNIASNVVSAIAGKANTFCLPLNLGLFSAFGGEHMAYPNLDVGGSRLTLYLEQANRILNSLAHNSINPNASDANILESNAVSTALPATNGTAANQFLFDNTAGFNFTRLADGDLLNDYCGVGFRPGMQLKNMDTADVADITAVNITNAGAVQVTCSSNLGTVDNGSSNIRVNNSSDLGYTIDKIELKVLETIPAPNTISQIRKAMMRGINFQSTQLTKISTGAELINAIIDIPSSISRALSIWSVPVDTTRMNFENDENTLMYPQIDSQKVGNANEISYQYQVRNILVPNRSVGITRTRSSVNQNDNPTFYNQQAMALRPIREAKCIAEQRAAEDLTNPFFIPILLAPHGSSFSLIDTDPLLRIENTATGADITQKLYHIYINHTRMLSATDGGVVVSI
tara:strand:- start:324 stop:1997 length:1674 start_codon:yes stop_codon:yes gene_type:complete